MADQVREPEVMALAFAFTMTLVFGPPKLMKTPRGGRVFAPVMGGEITGPRLTGKIMPETGADFGTVRRDGVEDLHTRFMLKATDGTDIYVQHIGYVREDGYIRLTPFFDVDRNTPHAWLNNTILVARGEPSQDGLTLTYWAVK